MYQPIPNLTQIISAVTNVKNDAPIPLNKPINILGIADGIAILNIFCTSDAPRVLETSKYDFFTLDIPELVSTVVGNHTPNAIMKILAINELGNATSATGIQAVDGIGPTNFTSGFTQ